MQSIVLKGLKTEEDDESEKMDIGGEKWERMQERVKTLEDYLGLGDGGTATSGGLTALRDDVALLKHKLGDFETLLQYFPMENLLEALRDLEELRGKLLRKTSQSKFSQKTTSPQQIILLTTADQSNLPPDLRLNEMDSKLSEYNQQIYNIEFEIKNELCNMAHQISNLEIEIGGIVEKLNTG